MEMKISALWLLKVLENVIQMQPRIPANIPQLTYSKLQALPWRNGIGLWIFRGERERGKTLQAQLNLISEERFSGGENKKRISGGALLEGLPHGNVKSKEKSFPAKIFLYFTVYNHREMSVGGKNVYFPRSTFPYMEEIFLPHALGEKIIRIFMAFLTPSSSPVLPQRKTGDLSNWYI